MGEIRKFEEYKREERKGDEVKFRSGRIQEREITRKIYSEVVIWVG